MTSTRAGLNLIIFGNVAGFLFAFVAAMLSVISLPLLIDRNVGFAQALSTSLKVVAHNPGPMAAWGLIVVGTLLFRGRATGTWIARPQSLRGS